MLLERITLRTIGPPPDHEAHHLVDRFQVLEIGVIVFGKYEVGDPLEGSATKRGKGPFLILGEDDVEAIKKNRMRRVQVDFANIIALPGPPDRIVILGIQFLTREV